MKRTVNEFWEMIVQVNAAFIFMLCNTIEGEKKKCFQYWPSREGSALQFGGSVFCVSLNAPLLKII